MPSYDHIVVGAGVAGMTAALLLAKSGCTVALIESFPQLAPTIRGFRRKGVYFDTGLHYVGGLGDGDPLDRYFKHLGIADSIKKVPYKSNGFDRFIVENKEEQFDIPCGFKAMASRLHTWFPQEKGAADKYVEAMQRVINASPFLNFDLDFNLEAALHDDAFTLQEFLDELTTDEDLKALLSYPNILYGVPPTEALLSTHALIAGSYLLSTHTIEGGGLALVKAYEAQLERFGVDVFTKATVRRIRVDEHRQVRGVTLDDDTKYDSISCVWTAHPQALIDATPDNAFRPAFKKRLAALQDTTSALMLFGISDTTVEELDGKNIISWPGTSYEKNMNGNVTPTEGILYLSSAFDPRSGKTAVTTIMPGRFDTFDEWNNSTRTNRPDAYKAYKQAALQEMEQEVYRRFPQFEKTIEFVDGATPLTFRDFCATPTGSLYGLRHSVDQFNPAPITKAAGLTLAGQSIVAPGILGAVISSYLTCGIILGHESLHNELRNIS